MSPIPEPPTMIQQFIQIVNPMLIYILEAEADGTVFMALRFPLVSVLVLDMVDGVMDIPIIMVAIGIIHGAGTILIIGPIMAATGMDIGMDIGMAITVIHPITVPVIIMVQGERSLLPEERV